MRGSGTIVELFKLVYRESELHRKILAFSVSHDASIVRIHGHYALIKDQELTFWRHPIRTFDFTEQDGKEKWTAYQFTKNVYFEFMPELHKLICSAIDQLPLKVAPTRLLSNPLQQVPLNASFGTDTDLDSKQPDSQDIAASAPESQNIAGSKKRKVTKAVLEQENEQYKGQNHQLLGQIDLLKQQQHSIASSGNESEGMAKLRQENEQYKGQNEQYKGQNHQLLGQIDLLKQQQHSIASSGNESEGMAKLRQENEQFKGQVYQLLGQVGLLQQQHSNANSGNDSEVVTMLRQESERQRQESEQQREEHKREMNELRDLLRQSLAQSK